MKKPGKNYLKNLARKAMKSQDFQTYMNPHFLKARAIKIACPLVDRVTELLPPKYDTMDGMQAVAACAKPYFARFHDAEVMQCEALVNEVAGVPHEMAIHFLFMDGEVYASDKEFFPYCH